MKKEYYLYLLLSSTMLGVPAVYAACVPTPDCEELGYTATECPEGGVKCPWDTTKLFCGPSCNLTTTKADCDANCLNVGTASCFKNGTMYYGGCGVSKCTAGQSCVNGTCTCDSVYKYSCNLNNPGLIPVGEGCNGLYKSCTCKDGYFEGISGVTDQRSPVICCESDVYKLTCQGPQYYEPSYPGCGGKYKKCICNQYYVWDGSDCVCESGFKYTCSGPNIIGPIGAHCNGKFNACMCAQDYEWKDGACVLSCDSSYQYTCSGANITGGSGTVCGGKYTACTCADGYEWKNGVCEQAVVCKVGHILNSDMTCSSSKVSGKTPIGVVSYISGSTRLAINLVHRSMQWGGYGTDISGLTNITSSSTAKNDFSGKSNTSKIVSALGDKSSYAAGYCYNYTTTGTSKGDWYLPAAGELYASIMTNYSAVNNGIKAAGGKQLSSDYYYWSSSEYGSKYAWEVVAYYGGVGYGGKSNNNSVRCVLAF